jgi:hypothetical protein
MMIVAEMHTPHNSYLTTAVWGLANKGQWFGKTWAVVFNEGLCVVVEASNEGDVLDALMDSHLGHLIRVPEIEAENDDFIWWRAGNASEAADLSDIAFVVKCKVHYFVNADHYRKTGRIK